MIPRKPAQSKHSKNIVVRVTPSMFDEVKSQALLEGLTVMDYVRKLHTEHMERRTFSPPKNITTEHIQHVKEQEKQS